ncbi:glutamate dehydrogenase [soil metagenome]
MEKSRFIVFFIFLFVVSTQKSFTQIGISHEVGVLVGPASFFTDYGERWNVKNNLENAGFGIGLIHYMNFAYRAECNCYATDNYFNDHFKLRTEIDYFYSDLEHFGPVASKDNLGGHLLRSMHGKSQIFEIGAALEYYPLSIRDFSSFAFMFSPYISLGAHYVYYKPSAFSDLGDLDNPKNVFPTFVGGMDFDGGSTWSIAGSIGLRYRLNVVSDLGIEARWHYYDSDWIDGLNINAPQNKFNDFLFWFNIGYIYYLNY